MILALGVLASNDACMECHIDEDLSKESGGKTVSLYVNGDLFGQTVHGKMDCTECHQDAVLEDYEHKSDLKADLNPSKWTAACVTKINPRIFLRESTAKC